MTVMRDRDLQRLLDRINWTFPESSIRDRRTFDLLDARQMHWYPATFIPEIPYSLIQVLSEPGQAILDPFAGTGTTIWQAELLGRAGHGLEINAVAVEIMRSTWAILSSGSPLEAFRKVRFAVSGSMAAGSLMELDSRLVPWYSDGTLDELRVLRHAQAALQTDAERGLLFLSISSLLRTLSEQRRGWGCVADNMKPRAQDLTAAPSSRQAITRVLQRALQIASGLESFAMGLRRRGLDVDARHMPSRIVEGNILDIAGLYDRSFDLVITSPPYPGMMDYATSQRLSHYWLGLDPDVALRSELGARRRRSRANSLDQYLVDMNRAFSGVGDVTARSGFLCLVLPEFENSSHQADRRAVLEAIVAHVGRSGFDEFWSAVRNLPTDRRQLNQGWAKLKRERIVVFRKR